MCQLSMIIIVLGALLDESTIIRQHALCDRGVHCSTDGEVSVMFMFS